MSEMRAVNYVLSPHTLVAAEHCPAARVYRGPRTKPSHAAWHGIAVHRFLQYCQQRGREEALEYIRAKFPRAYATCELIDTNAIPSGQVEAQLLIDMRSESVVLLEEYENVRTEELVENHVKVRCDLFMHSTPHVIDYKTGNRPLPIGADSQRLTEALGAWLYHGKPASTDSSIVRIVKERERVDLAWDTVTHSAQELSGWFKRLRRVHLQVLETRAERRDEGIEPEYVPGVHCSGCDCRAVCPHALP